METFLIHHLGLGDQIVHNGMIRKLANEDDKVTIVSKKHNYENVQYMLRDVSNVEVIPVQTGDPEMFNYAAKFKGKIVSSYLLNNPDKLKKYYQFFDDAFYMVAGIDPSIMQDWFHIERDFDREIKVHEKLVNGIEEYVFVHDENNRKINEKLLPNLPVVRADKRYNFFDLLYTMEKAKECHVISSSFSSLFICKKFNENITAHMYAGRDYLSEYVSKHGVKVIK